VAGDFEALAMLTRIAAIMGLGTSFTGTTHSGSMAEHMISHYIDMFAGKAHPGTSHGEQVGVATLTMSRLQNQILGKDYPPTMRPTEIPTAELRVRFGTQADEMIEQSRRKSLDTAKADSLNQRLQQEWPKIAGQLRTVMLPWQKLHDAISRGCPLTSAALGLSPEFYRDAVFILDHSRSFPHGWRKWRQLEARRNLPMTVNGALMTVPSGQFRLVPL
jgi:glycerol-1-phosphate dehydrogenase [NAD(P)+]